MENQVTILETVNATANTMALEHVETLVHEMLSSHGFIVLNKKAVRIFGLEAAALLGELTSKAKYLKDKGELTVDGFFYSTIEDVEENTSLKARTQQRLLADLKAKGLLEVELKGMPARRHIKINYVELFKAMR